MGSNFPRKIGTGCRKMGVPIFFCDTGNYIHNRVNMAKKFTRGVELLVLRGVTEVYIGLQKASQVVT